MTALVPGQDCPTCSRRVPLPKTEKSPPSKKKAYWIPSDIAGAHQEIIDTVAEFLGCKDKPYYEAKVMEFCAVFARQHEELRGVLA